MFSEGAPTASIPPPDHNRVAISGGTVSGNVYGGYAESASGAATSTGNTFNLHSACLTVAGLSDFQNQHFFIPGTLAVGGAMVNVAGTAYVGGTAVSVSVDGAHSSLRGGDYFVLIDAVVGEDGGLDGSPVNDRNSSERMRVR
ncbi:MAG: hypothetical protein FWF31_06005 [Desulfobulbus sp.]|nr:hypothetical protein [Desulfobulbus sp.]